MSTYTDLWDAIKAELDEKGAVTRAEVQAVLDRFPREEPPVVVDPPVVVVPPPVVVEPEPSRSYSPPEHISRDGSRDVSADLNDWLRTVPDGSIVDLGQGVYRCETRVKADDRTDLVIRGGTFHRTVEGAIVYPEPNPHLWLLRPTRCKVEDLTVRGTNARGDTQHVGFGAYKVAHEFDAAIRMEEFVDCTVTGLDADAVWGDGVQWQSGRGVYMADSRIDRNGRQGVTLIARDVLVERVRVEHGRRAGFDIEPDTGGQDVGNIEIRHCYSHTNLLTFASGGPGEISDVWLHDNHSEGSGIPLLYIASTRGYTGEELAVRSRWTLERHTFTGPAGSPAPALWARNVRDLTIKDCRIPVVTTQSRLVLGLESCGGTVTLTGNDFGPGGQGYFSRTPMADLRMVVEGNSPELAEVEPSW